MRNEHRRQDDAQSQENKRRTGLCSLITVLHYLHYTTNANNNFVNNEIKPTKRAFFQTQLQENILKPECEEENVSFIQVHLATKSETKPLRKSNGVPIQVSL